MTHLFSRAFALCFLATLIVNAAQAQQAVPGSAPPAAQGPGTSSSSTPGHLALARELASLTGMLSMYDGFLPTFGEQIRRGAVIRPELTKDLNQVLDALKPELEQQKQLMVATTARLYASSFSEAELKDLVTYFKTPIGQKYLQLAPQIFDDLAVETERWTQRVSEYVMTRVRAEMGKRGHQM